MSMADNAEKDELVAALKAKADALAVQLAEQAALIPQIAAERREVVRQMVELVGHVRTAQELGVSRQAVHQLLRK